MMRVDLGIELEGLKSCQKKENMQSTFQAIHRTTCLSVHQTQRPIRILFLYVYSFMTTNILYT